MNYSHGHCVDGKITPEYRAWYNMIERCYSEGYKKYHRYGGRGITVCAQWQTDFQAFMDHVGLRPSAKHSLDRHPDNEGNYEPGNVRWATPKEQQRNRSDNRIVAYLGRRMTIAEACELANLPADRGEKETGFGLERG